ncbi:MAG: amidohydrolase family protein [Micromonosporaceae bacterium]
MSGRVIDAHVHVATMASLKPPMLTWTAGFPSTDVPDLYDSDGRPRPAVFASYLDAEGVDCALLFSEYSPRVTGWQTIEDCLPFAEHDPSRFRLVANINPHIHYPLLDELRRQLDLGAIALKLHPVHAGFAMDSAEMYPVYAYCEAQQVPVIVHAGTSTFPGARNRFASLDHLVDVVRDFPGCSFVLAHGGRGWSFDTAAFLALSCGNVWIDIAGLPPHRLPEYFARHALPRLARRFIFGSDWPGLPGIAHNIAVVRKLGLPADVTADVLGGNAERVFRL